jgi:hypothetical protein
MSISTPRERHEGGRDPSVGRLNRAGARGTPFTAVSGVFVGGFDRWYGFQ